MGVAIISTLWVGAPAQAHHGSAGSELIKHRIPNGQAIWFHRANDDVQDDPSDPTFSQDTTDAYLAASEGDTRASSCNFTLTLRFESDYNEYGDGWWSGGLLTPGGASNEGTETGTGAASCTVGDSATAQIGQSVPVSLRFDEGRFSSSSITRSVDFDGILQARMADGSILFGVAVSLNAPPLGGSTGTMSTRQGDPQPPVTVSLPDDRTATFSGNLVVDPTAITDPTHAETPGDACETLPAACDDLPVDSCGLVAALCEIPSAPGADTEQCGNEYTCEAFAALAARSEPPHCIANTATQYGIRIIYAHPKDRRNQLQKLRPFLLARVGQSNARLQDEGRRSGGPAPSYNVVCDSGRPAMTAVKMPFKEGQHKSATLYTKIVDELGRRGLDSPSRHYLIFYDGSGGTFRKKNRTYLYGGRGSRPTSDTADASNPANGTQTQYAAVWRGIWTPADIMHEVGHNMGAVQLSAPHSSGAGHCNDGLDIMCYDDNGPHSRYRKTACPNRERFDCGYDDYFNTSASPPDYLRTHWNIGSRTNRFLFFP